MLFRQSHELLLIGVLPNLKAPPPTGSVHGASKAGATLRYLPKYSPDLNPVEMAYSQFKEFLRSAEARTVVGIAIRSFLPSLSAQACANYLKHAGYASM
jgi:transposase